MIINFDTKTVFLASNLYAAVPYCISKESPLDNDINLSIFYFNT